MNREKRYTLAEKSVLKTAQNTSPKSSAMVVSRSPGQASCS